MLACWTQYALERLQIGMHIIKLSKIYIREAILSCDKSLQEQCQVFRNANAVNGGPLGESTWLVLNYNDIYAAPFESIKGFLLLSLYKTDFLMSNISPVC